MNILIIGITIIGALLYAQQSSAGFKTGQDLQEWAQVEEMCETAPSSCNNQSYQ